VAALKMSMVFKMMFKKVWGQRAWDKKILTEANLLKMSRVCDH
jgi:hypothetical protein